MLIEIKQTPDQTAASIGLDKPGNGNRSKLPGCFEYIQPAKSTDGRWITGIDEKSTFIRSIQDPELRKIKEAEVKAIREELELLTGWNLSATNDEFWGSYYIKITDRDHDKLVLQFDNPKDKIKYYALIANGIAPDMGATSSPDFAFSKFYVSREQEEVGDKVIKSRLKDKATSELYKMYDNKQKLLLIGKYLLGAKIKDEMSIDSIYNSIRDFISNDKEKGVGKFLECTSKTVEELQYKLILDEAIIKHVIRIRDGYYQRGNVTYGKTLSESLIFLSSIENQGEFLSIKEELDEKNKYG
jgi:hypothetical protein